MKKLVDFPPMGLWEIVICKMSPTLCINNPESQQVQDLFFKFWYHTLYPEKDDRSLPPKKMSKVGDADLPKNTQAYQLGNASSHTISSSCSAPDCTSISCLNISRV